MSILDELRADRDAKWKIYHILVSEAPAPSRRTPEQARAIGLADASAVTAARALRKLQDEMRWERQKETTAQLREEFPHIFGVRA